MRLLRIAFVVGIIALLSLAMAPGVPPAYADDIPGGKITDPGVRAIDVAQPAVVRIITFINGTLTVHFSSGDATFSQSGSNGYQLVLSGSGTFISAHGDILTADHVVNPPHTDLDPFLQQTAAPDVANYMNQTLRVNPPVTAAQVTQELASGQLASSSHYDTPQSRVYLSTSFTGSLSAPDFQSIPSNVFANVDRIEAQSLFTQKDVAIVHVSNMDDMAMVQLGDSGGVQTQDILTIIGFPGNGDVSVTPTNLLTSSIIPITVSSIKTSDTGAPLIQVSGNVEHGDSGGPALDAGGNVVGIVSFGSSSGPGTSFLQASNSARMLVQSLGLNTTPGAFQTAWGQAFSDYGATTPGHWHKAAQEFQQLSTRYPLFKVVMRYLMYAQAQAKNERVPTVQPTTQPTTQPAAAASSFLANNWPLLVGGVVIILGIGLFGAVMFSRRSPRRGTLTKEYNYPASATFGVQPTINSSPPPLLPLNQKPAAFPAQSIHRPQPNDALSSFGAPPASSASSWPVTPAPPAPRPASFASRPPEAFSTSAPTAPTNNSSVLVPWPCGHMNRPIARFCSVCGEPAPPPPARRYEQ